MFSSKKDHFFKMNPLILCFYPLSYFTDKSPPCPHIVIEVRKLLDKIMFLGGEIMKLLIIKKRFLLFSLILIILLASAGGWFLINQKSEVVFEPINNNENARDIHLVTGEFSSKLPDGTEIEAYRWDPGTIFVQVGEKVNLNILGVNGNEHPFMIENTSIKGIIKKGEETVIPLQFNKEGVYRLICLTHIDEKSEGPMIAYIVVD
jgi:plastocyanin